MSVQPSTHIIEDIQEVLVSKEQIQAKVAEMGEVISKEYEGKDLLMVCILKGALVFMSDLMRCISIPLSIDTMAVTSYGASTVSSGVVKIVKDLDVPIEGRHVLIVEDIIDTGLTLSYLISALKNRKPLFLLKQNPDVCKPCSSATGTVECNLQYPQTITPPWIV